MAWINGNFHFEPYHFADDWWGGSGADPLIDVPGLYRIGGAATALLREPLGGLAKARLCCCTTEHICEYYRGRASALDTHPHAVSITMTVPFSESTYVPTEPIRIADDMCCLDLDKSYTLTIRDWDTVETPDHFPDFTVHPGYASDDAACYDYECEIAPDTPYGLLIAAECGPSPPVSNPPDGKETVWWAQLRSAGVWLGEGSPPPPYDCLDTIGNNNISYCNYAYYETIGPHNYSGLFVLNKVLPAFYNQERVWWCKFPSTVTIFAP